MEGDRIYEESKAELRSVLQRIDSDSVTISMKLLDGNTKLDITTVIQKVMSERCKTIDKLENSSIYEESVEEMKAVLRTLSGDYVTLDFSKLDDNTKRDLISVLKKVIHERLRSIDKVILGAK